MHYRPRLHGVRLADDAMGKDVLGLLFQLVQWQMRKADKFREVWPSPWAPDGPVYMHVP